MNESEEHKFADRSNFKQTIKEQRKKHEDWRSIGILKQNCTKPNRKKTKKEERER